MIERSDALIAATDLLQNSRNFDIVPYTAPSRFKVCIYLDILNPTTINEFNERLKVSLLTLPVVQQLIADAIRMDNFKRDI